MNYREIVDGIIFIDDVDSAKIIVFNFRRWVTVIQAIMVKYGGKSEGEAEALIMDDPWLVKEALTNVWSAIVRAHDLEYHWAMILVHGEQYWHRGVSEVEPEGLWEWEVQYAKDHSLKEYSFGFEKRLVAVRGSFTAGGTSRPNAIKVELAGRRGWTY